ncbi:MAG: RagB/SusD family nutrient uptake outer membrane protein [Bacteroidaceae bacterium]|nr:RagB/SusD family nutrient uptake outer membrane protein [Bacteroidaceae bacterium]
MKTKSIIFSGLLLASLGAATTSCEDMLSVDDELHTTNLAPQDTVYQIMGIINRMQSLVDRTLVLGELRADLVDLDPTVAKTSLQDVMNNNITTENEYNQISDYYAVVNACNVYLSYVDSDFVSHNQKHFEKEIQAVKVFRAWTYLELAKTYGKVPFVLDPVLVSSDADDIVASTTNRADMNEICTYFINDLLPYASKIIETPNFGTINEYYTSSKFFIPVRLMLGELYLWRGSFTQNQSDFVEACRYYHDYVCFTNQEVTTGTSSSTWDRRFRDVNEGYSINNDAIAFIPLDTCAYDGTWSEIYGFFNSQFENSYYVPVIPSKRVRELSQEQIYCGYFEELGNRDTLYSIDKVEWEDSLEMGDLRLVSVYDRSQVSDQYTDRFAKDRQHIMKYASSTSNAGPDSKIREFNLYRKNIIWLHFAEALNRAGFPETAFAILKYGISYDTMSKYVSTVERAALYQVGTYFLGTLGSWPSNVFVDRHSSNAAQPNVTVSMQGIHSRGCGDSYYNKYYVLPHDPAIWAKADSLEVVYDSVIARYRSELGTREMREIPEDSVDLYDGIVQTRYIPDIQGYRYYVYVFESDSDSIAFAQLIQDEGLTYSALNTERNAAYTASVPQYQAALEQMILDEEALEGMFEGLRFYDLMRYAMYHNDPDFIANQVARRKGAGQYDTRADALKGGKWYLPLP